MTPQPQQQTQDRDVTLMADDEPARLLLVERAAHAETRKALDRVRALLQFREDECQRLRAGIVDSRR